MERLPIALVAVIVVLAFVGGYFTGLLNSAGNFTLNVTNQTADDYESYYNKVDNPTQYSTAQSSYTPTQTASSSSPSSDTSASSSSTSSTGDTGTGDTGTGNTGTGNTGTGTGGAGGTG